MGLGSFGGISGEKGRILRGESNNATQLARSMNDAKYKFSKDLKQTQV